VISRAVLGLVLIVSCAHALVHVYELSLPSVEQLIAVEYFPSASPREADQGKMATGWLAFAWRLPFGGAALLAGWLVDRYGARRMLAVYLLGCGVCCLAAGITLPLPALFVVMFLMGLAASVYHPAGLALISFETNPVNRPRAWGLHGIFGSAGIGVAPFLAGAVLAVAPSWRTYYQVLAVPGLLLGGVFVGMMLRRPGRDVPRAEAAGGTAQQIDDATDWRSFFTLTGVAALMGFIYASVLSFLPRYMDGAGLSLGGIEARSARNYLAGGALLLGCIGQYLAGRFARPGRLELQLAGIAATTGPLLYWMAVAESWQRPLAAGLFSLVHFMHQPVYNSLIAKYTPRRRRSLSYGFSFTMGFGIGSFGAPFAGSRERMDVFATLAVLALLAGLLSLCLRRTGQAH